MTTTMNAYGMNAYGAVPGVRRGCGMRQQGAAYIECGLGPGGQPLEHFLADPPIPFVPDKAVGQDLVERGGVVHVVDWIGETHYPNAADFLEEVRVYGLSRRASRNTDFHRLTSDSRILCVHPRGYIENAHVYAEAVGRRDAGSRGDALRERCGIWSQQNDATHLANPDLMCTRHLWIFAEHDTAADGDDAAGGDVTMRHFVDTFYEVFPLPAPDGSRPAPDWSPAIVASFPITRIAVVESDEGDHKATAERISRTTTLPVAVTPA